MWWRLSTIFIAQVFVNASVKCTRRVKALVLVASREFVLHARCSGNGTSVVHLTRAG